MDEVRKVTCVSTLHNKCHTSFNLTNLLSYVKLREIVTHHTEEKIFKNMRFDPTYNVMHINISTMSPRN